MMGSAGSDRHAVTITGPDVLDYENGFIGTSVGTDYGYRYRYGYG